MCSRRVIVKRDRAHITLTSLPLRDVIIATHLPDVGHHTRTHTQKTLDELVSERDGAVTGAKTAAHKDKKPFCPN